MDTTHLEYTAEDLIAHKLQRSGLLVAKPKFDRDGADLIALLDVADGAKFSRIQCKGRSLKSSPNSNVKIPAEYVSGSFFCFLYIDTGDNETFIFCFSVNDIKSNWILKTKNDKEFYILNIYKNTFSKPSHIASLLNYLFDSKKIELIKNNINKSISKDEINLMNFIKIQNELLDINKKYYVLKNIISEYEHIEQLNKLNEESIKITTKQYEDMLTEFEDELPEILVRRINELSKENMSVPEIINGVKELIPDEIPVAILSDFISNILIKRIKN